MNNGHQEPNQSNIIHPLSNVGMGLAPSNTFQVWNDNNPSVPHTLSDMRFGK